MMTRSKPLWMKDAACANKQEFFFDEAKRP